MPVHQYPRRSAEINGLTTTYVDVGSGPAVVLLHGIGMSSLAWEHVVGELAQDHRVLSVDLAGFGSSDGVDWSPDVQPYADRVLDLLEHLGVGPAVLVGHSFGGLVAQRAASSGHTNVGKLVLVCSPGNSVSRRRLVAGSLALVALRETISSPPAVLGMTHFRPFRHAVVRALCGDRSATDGGLADDVAIALARGLGSRGFYRALTASIRDLWSSRRLEIICPTLVMCGDRDPAVTVDLAQELATSLPDGRLIVFEGSGHMPQLSEPEAWMALLLPFLDSPDASDLKVG